MLWIWFDDSRREEVATYLTNPWAVPYQSPLDKTSDLIDGFESPFGMELLTTVDWLITKAGCAATVQSLREGLAKWPAGKEVRCRKLKLFDDDALKVAVDQLTKCELVTI